MSIVFSKIKKDMSYDAAVELLIDLNKKHISCEVEVDGITLSTKDILHNSYDDAKEDLRIAYCNRLALWINNRADKNDNIEQYSHHR